MAQLIETDTTLPSQIHIAKDDVLLIRAAGGQIVSGNDVVEVLGPLTTAILQPSGFSLSPEGPPNVVLFVAKDYGTAVANVVFGDPFFSPQPTEFEIIVE